MRVVAVPLVRARCSALLASTHPLATQWDLQPIPPPHPPCSDGCSKLFMMPLPPKKRTQNAVQGTPVLSVLSRLAAAAMEVDALEAELAADVAAKGEAARKRRREGKVRAGGGGAGRGAGGGDGPFQTHTHTHSPSNHAHTRTRSGGGGGGGGGCC